MERFQLPVSAAHVRDGVAHRYATLLEQHENLETEIEAESRRRLPDMLLLQRLKRRKLRLKDELGTLERLFDAIGAKVEGGTDALSARSAQAVSGGTKAKALPRKSTRRKSGGGRIAGIRRPHRIAEGMALS